MILGSGSKRAQPVCTLPSAHNGNVPLNPNLLEVSFKKLPENGLYGVLFLCWGSRPEKRYTELRIDEGNLFLLMWICLTHWTWACVWHSSSLQIHSLSPALPPHCIFPEACIMNVCVRERKRQVVSYLSYNFTQRLSWNGRSIHMVTWRSLSGRLKDSLWIWLYQWILISLHRLRTVFV